MIHKKGSHNIQKEICGKIQYDLYIFERSIIQNYIDHILIQFHDKKS